MLVQKVALSKNMKILLITLGVIVVIGGGYFAYTKFFSATSPTTVQSTEAAITPHPNVPTFDDAVFNDPRFYQLTKQTYSGFTNQYEGISLSKTVPLPPVDIKVENPARGRVLVISWQLPEYINFSRVRVYRSANGIAAEEIALLNVSSDAANAKQSYQDTGLEDNKTYYYLVRTVTADNLESTNDQSVKNIPTDIISPQPPTDIRVSPQSDGTVEISWANPTDSDFSSVNIYRSTERGVLGKVMYSGNKGQTMTSDLSRQFAVDENIAANTAYYYTVTSVDQDGNQSSTDVLAVPFRATDYNPFEPVIFE
jgi:hypothetical protein